MNSTQEEPSTRKEREFEQRKTLILDVAESLFAEQGFSATRMEDIAKHAEFGVGTLYKFFKNKDDLYAEMLRLKVEAIEPKVTESIEQGEYTTDKLHRYFDARIQMYWDHPLFFRVYYRDLAGGFSDSTSGLTPDVQERYSQHLAQIESVFADGIADGIFRDVSPQLLTVLSEGVLRSYMAELARRNETNRDEDEEKAVFEIFLAGIVSETLRQR